MSADCNVMLDRHLCHRNEDGVAVNLNEFYCSVRCYVKKGGK